MNLQGLSKEQKQYLVLGVITAIMLSILIVFGIKVSLSSISEARLELQGLAEKIEEAEKSVSQNERDNVEFLQTIAELRVHLDNMPPDRNYYSWATELIYDEARMVRFEIDAIDEIVMAEPTDDLSGQDGVVLESYSLRITAHGGYESVKRFFNRISSNHPLVRVTGIEISTGSEPEVHDVQLFIEWPFNLDYITETWTSIPKTPSLSDNLSIRQSELPIESSAASESGPTDRKKQPVPPPPRTTHSAPDISDGSMENNIPMTDEKAEDVGESEEQLEAMPKP